MAQLFSLVENGTIREFQTIRLLSESGDKTIENMKNNIQRIVIDDLGYLEENDRILLASMINRLLPLEAVYFKQFNLNSSLIPPVKRFLSSVAVFKVDILVIEDTHLTYESLIGYSDIFRQCLTERICLNRCQFTKLNLIRIALLWRSPKIQIPDLQIRDSKMSGDLYREIAFTLKSIGCNHVWFSGCNLTTKKLSELNTGCKKNNLALQQLTVSDRTMPVEAYSDEATIIKTTKCTNVGFLDCDLSKDKLEYFGLRCKEMQVSLQMLSISDKSMKEDQYETLSHILKLLDCEELQLQRCCLTKTKLQGLLRGFRNQNIKLKTFIMSDKSLEEDGYDELIHILKLSDCKMLQLEKCCLTVTKLQALLRGCCNENIQLPELTIIDSTMPSDAYSALAAVVKSSNCTDVCLGYCDLSTEKLECLRMGCKENQVTLRKLGIFGNFMTEDQCEILTHIVKLSDCKVLLLKDCCLTKAKLQEMRRGCWNQNIQLPKLIIVDNTMPVNAYPALADVFKASKCTYVLLGNCDLSKEKLDCLSMRCKENQVTLPKLIIVDKTMPSDAYPALVDVCKSSNCTYVHLGNCDLSKEKLECLSTRCKENQVTISTLEIDWSKSTATEDEVSALCDLMTSAVEKLFLFDWEIDAKGTQRIIDTLQIESSKATFLRLPNGDTFTKSRPEEKPLGIRQSEPIQENQENDTIQQRQQRVASQHTAMDTTAVTSNTKNSEFTESDNTTIEGDDDSFTIASSSDDSDGTTVEKTITQVSTNGNIPTTASDSQDEVTEHIGPEGKTIEIDGCFITFPAGCFDQTRRVSIKADIDPEAWPRGTVGITPVLQIEAPDLKVPATVKLATWCIPDANEGGLTVDVLRFSRDKKHWELVQSSHLGTSRSIEFEIDHFSDILGTIKNFLLGIYVLLPTCYYSGNRFAVTTAVDNETALRKCRNKIEEEFGDMVTSHKYDTFHSQTSHSIKSKIRCVSHPDDFKFTMPEFKHPVKEVREAGGSRVDFTTLESKERASEVTIEFQLFQDGLPKRGGTFPYYWKPSDIPKKEEEIVSNVGKDRGVSSSTVTTVNLTLNTGPKTANTMVEAGGRYESDNKNCEVRVNAPGRESSAI